MKSILSASALALCAMSFGAGPAQASTGHAAAPHSHEHHGTHSASQNSDAHASTLGKPGDPAKVTRTMTVDMNDTMKFSPAMIAVKKGETIRFVVKNSGKIKHEMVLGSAAELKAHAAMMQKMPEMEHADENMVSVEPGKTGEIVWQFTRTGKFDFACLQPGHFEAGMKGKLVVK